MNCKDKEILKLCYPGLRRQKEDFNTLLIPPLVSNVVANKLRFLVFLKNELCTMVERKAPLR